MNTFDWHRPRPGLDDHDSRVGHFIVARLFRVRVDVFSIGFWAASLGWKRGATTIALARCRSAAYVRMAGQDLSEVDSNDVAPTGVPDELMSKQRWQRALISFAVRP